MEIAFPVTSMSCKSQIAYKEYPSDCLIHYFIWTYCSLSSLSLSQLILFPKEDQVDLFGLCEDVIKLFQLFSPQFFFPFFGSFVKQIKGVLYTGSFSDTTSNTCYDSLHTKTKRTMCHSQPVTTSFIFLLSLHQFEIVLH